MKFPIENIVRYEGCRCMRRWTTVIIVLAVLSLPFLLFSGERRTQSAVVRGPSVAVIELSGTISDSGGNIQSQETNELLRRAQQNPDVRAVVVRINSGGGSVGASQEIYHEIRRTSDMGKPVVVSMADTAASGGYYIAAAGDRVFANPGTMTGSIGVIFQFQVVQDLLEDWGISSYTLTSGEHKAVGNPLEHPSEAAVDLLHTMIEDILEQFIADVARGRNLDPEDVRAIADGRIMTGRQAFELGLVDELGGLEDALLVAAEMVGIEGRPRVVTLRREVPWQERLFPFPISTWSPEKVAAFFGITPWGYHVR